MNFPKSTIAMVIGVVFRGRMRRDDRKNFRL
jgi:hypothetical protein